MFFLIHLASNGTCFLHFDKPKEDEDATSFIDKLTNSLNEINLNDPNNDDESAAPTQSPPAAEVGETPKLNIELVKRTEVEVSAV